MSLVYAKKNDEIGCVFVCASRVSTCDRSVWYRDLDVEEHQESCGYACTRVYLLT
jgi:hypothetical protein